MSERFTSTKFSHPHLINCRDLPGVDRVLTDIRSDKIGGQLLRQNLMRFGQTMGDFYRRQEIGAIIGLPRSGVPISSGLSISLPGYTYILANTGANRKNDVSIFPAELKFNETDGLLIADAVIVTGKTILSTIDSLLSIGGSANRISVFTAFASEFGVETLLRIFPEITIFIGEFVKTKQHWDPHRWKISLTLDGIPNIGALVSRP